MWLDLTDACLQRIDPGKIEWLNADAAVCFPGVGENALRQLIVAASSPVAFFAPNFVDAQRRGVAVLPPSAGTLIRTFTAALQKGEYALSGIDASGKSRRDLSALIARGEPVELVLRRMGVEGGVRIGGVLFTGVRVQAKEDEQRWARPGNKEKDDPALIERGVALRMSGAARSNIKAAEMVTTNSAAGAGRSKLVRPLSGAFA